IIDQTTYSSSVGSGQTWARFKDPITGRPMDTNNDAVDFYVSLAPSPARGNDRHRPTISVVKTGSRVVAAPGQLITYTVYYNNTDTGMAKTAWINDTLPSGAVFSSSSVPYTYVIGPMYGWLFTNVMPGAHSLTVTVQVSATTTDGQVLRNTVTLDYTDQLSRSLPRSRGWANTTVSRPTITVVKTASPANAKAGDLVTFTIYYNNSGSVAAGTVTIKDSLPQGFDYVGASPVPTWTNGRYSGTVRRPPQGWTASVPGSSAQALLKGRQASRRLAHCTTAGNVGGLNFRVRDGTGCIPAALAVKPLLRRPRGCAIYQDFDVPTPSGPRPGPRRAGSPRRRQEGSPRGGGP